MILKRFSLAAAAAALSAAAAPAPLGAHADATRQADTVLETFTGATADPRFQAFGSACLTGAPQGTPPGPGLHPLGGCSSTPAGPVPPGSGAPFGYLQLTDASENQAGAVLLNSPTPSSRGVDVTFEQWQYGNTSGDAADGLSFFLVDGAATLTQPGAFGGSLGYAQKLPDDDPQNTFLPGVNGGYLGIGFDVFGGFYGDAEQRGDGCALRSPAGTTPDRPPGPNMVTVRGPGNGTAGYCFLTATTSNFSATGARPSTLPGRLHGPLTDISSDPETAQADLEPSKRTVRIRITPAPNPIVTVDVDFNDGAGFQQVLSFPAPQPVPASYLFGFAASTGGATDVHLIRNVRIAELASSPPAPSPSAPGPSVPMEPAQLSSASTASPAAHETGGAVRHKKENFVGFVATMDRSKLHKKLREIHALLEQAKHRHLGRNVNAKRPRSAGPR
ncbi:hypothetical protein Pth03_26480 [Planotetraspora thailandica]|uniref:Legume lectin domain-containing protein n=1 Tax=Planotetraspora thailandica TaxID=487172 RepID=A0A8J3XVF7_9ACTN|nr:hypothetical protein [Planotetraspora thailandica]GII54259.1 hypothetical protein Pth03_26480 [Planotetraspora thailandica]